MSVFSESKTLQMYTRRFDAERPRPPQDLPAAAARAAHVLVEHPAETAIIATATVENKVRKRMTSGKLVPVLPVRTGR